ncbi:MAG TPA: hypothetical protein VIN77_16805 [Aurantimonas sp.]
MKVSEARLAQKARHRLATLMRRARAVTVTPTGGHSYDRTLARVLIDGRDVGAILVIEELATVRMGSRSTWC